MGCALPSQKLKCPPKGTILKGNFIFQPSCLTDMLFFRGVYGRAMFHRDYYHCNVFDRPGDYHVYPCMQTFSQSCTSYSAVYYCYCFMFCFESECVCQRWS